jgi:hypothetical protein
MSTLVLRVGPGGGGPPAMPAMFVGRATARAPGESISNALRATPGDAVDAVEAVVAAQLGSVHPSLPFSLSLALEAVEGPGFTRLDAVRTVHTAVHHAFECEAHGHAAKCAHLPPAGRPSVRYPTQPAVCRPGGHA